MLFLQIDMCRSGGRCKIWVKILRTYLTLFLPAMGEICPYMSVTWQQPLGIGLNSNKICKILELIMYARHNNPLLIRNRSWILTIHKVRILRKKGPWKNVFGLQKVGKKYTNRWLGYNGVHRLYIFKHFFSFVCLIAMLSHHCWQVCSFL